VRRFARSIRKHGYGMLDNQIEGACFTIGVGWVDGEQMNDSTQERLIRPGFNSHWSRRKLGFRFLAMMLGLLPFVVIELALRAFDLPKQDVPFDPFLDMSQLAPLFEKDSNGICRIPNERMRLFSPAEFSFEKPAATTRVFSLGGSTTQGEPYGPPTAFTNWLRINLELIGPSRKWEAINCGGLSYASYRVLPILREVLNYSPDLIVVYCGHNEFLEERELGGWKRTPTIATGLISRLYRLRMVQYVSSIARAKSANHVEDRTTRLHREVDALLDSQGGLEKYHRNSLDAPNVVASFRWNLQQMAEACQARHVPLVFVVPTANLRDSPPFKFEIDLTLSHDETQRIETLWLQSQEGEADTKRVCDAMQKILAMDPRHAGAHYYLGQRAIAEKDWDNAKSHLIAAKDYDVCPLRAISAIQQTVRDSASEYRVPLLDADALFQSKCANGIVGHPWLIDHVHPGIEGHQLLGEALAELLVQNSWLAPEQKNWQKGRVERYRDHLNHLGEAYYIRGQQRLEGLILWTQGRAKKIGVE